MHTLRLLTCCRIITVVLAALAVPLASAGPATWDQVSAQSAGSADVTSSYGDHPDQFGELRLPNGPGSHPVVVLIHGGCWLPNFDLDHARPLAEMITTRGFATWTVEYRRPNEGEDGWPETFKDVAAAHDKLRVLAKHHDLDLARIKVIGHSAGGQLALWLAARPAFRPDHPFAEDEPLPVHHVVALAPITDMSTYAETEEGCPAGARRVLGGSPEHYPARYRAVSPLNNPALNTKLDLVHAVEDSIVPIDQSEAFVQRINQSGGRAVLHQLAPPAGHFDVLITEGPAWDLLQSLLMD